MPAATVHVEHSTPVPGSVAQVWRALLDPQRVAAAVPGLRLDPPADGGAPARLKIRFGDVAPTLRGTVRVVERNARAHRVVLDAQGAAARDEDALTAAVTATVRRNGDAVIVRIVADVQLAGRPAQLDADRQQAAIARVIARFAAALIGPDDEGAPVADSPNDNAAPDPDDAAAPRRRPSPGPASAAESAPADAAGPVEQAPAESTPSFGTPGGIPVPSLADQPSVNGHAVPSARPIEPETPLAASTRQAMAKRIAPVALGIVFVLAAARRRRGRSA